MDIYFLVAGGRVGMVAVMLLCLLNWSLTLNFCVVSGRWRYGIFVYAQVRFTDLSATGATEGKARERRGREMRGEQRG